MVWTSFFAGAVNGAVTLLKQRFIFPNEGNSDNGILEEIFQGIRFLADVLLL